MRRKRSPALLCEELEPRLLLSADIAGIAVDLTPNASELSDDETDLESIVSELNSESLIQSDETSPAARELLIVDPDVPDYQDLIAGITGPGGGEVSYEVVVLDPQLSGIDQIGEILAEENSLDAIHLISHGADAVIRVGGDSIDLATLQQNADVVQAWGDALTAEGDILIYGCNLAANEMGEALVDELARLTGADVAASDDLTGHESLGGDWELEYQVGSIESPTIARLTDFAGWQGMLDITSNLVGHYTFDEGSGITAGDSSATGNDGTLIGSPAWATGHVGSGALNFSGDFDRVEALDNPATDFGSGNFSVGFWFNSTHSGSTGRLVGDMDGGDGYVFYTNGSGDVTWSIISGASNVVLTANGVMDGSWHHVVGVRNGADFELYVDNNLVDSTTDGTLGSIDNTNTLRIGASSASHNEFDGLVDEVRLYDRALSSTDVTELFYVGSDTAPTFSSLDGTPTFVEDGAAVVLDADVTVADTELDVLNSGNGNYDGASLTLVRNGGANSDDVFGFADGNGITLSGGNLIKNSQAIASFDTATTAGQLVITFTDANGETPTSVDVDNILQQLTYANSNDNPSASAQIDWTFDDGDATDPLQGTGSTTVDITAVNDNPTVSNLDGDILNYTEGDGAVLIEQGGDVLVSDIDSNDFNGGSLTVEVDSGLQASEDVFSIRNEGTSAGQIGVSGSDVTYGGTVIGTFAGGTGFDPLAVNLNANATQAAVTALVQNITYENSNIDDPTAGSRSVVVDITDGDGGASVTQNLTLNVTSVNDAPVVDLNGADGAGVDFAVTFTEDAGAVNVVDTDATISDPDSATYESLSINLSNFLDGLSEQVVVAGYTFTYGTADTVIRTVGSTSFELDFDGTGFNVMLDGGGGMPSSDLQTLLRGITYENASQNPTVGDRLVSIFAQDSSLLSGFTATSTITVNPQNDAPTATNNTNTVAENGFISGNVITDDSGHGVDSDPEGDALQVSQVDGGNYTPGIPLTLASGAQVTFQSSGIYTYNTDGQFDGLGAGNSVDDSFTYQVSDGNGGFDTATVTITINGSNDAPVLDSASLTVGEGQTVTLSGSDFGITDPDDTSFTFALSAISGGQFELATAPGAAITSFSSAQLAANQVVFVDNGDETAPSFDVTVNDGSANSNTLTATITYTPQNDVPVLDSTALSVTEGTTVTLTAANFGVTDPDDTSFTYNLTAITGGQFELTTVPGAAITSFDSTQLAASQVVFVDNGDETAPSFDVTVNDGSFNSNTLSAAITYTPQNDTPVLDTATLSVTEGATVTLTAVNFGITDPDSSSFTYNLTAISGGQFELTTAPGVSITSFSSVQLAANQVVFVDNGDETAPSFDVTVNDGSANSNTLSASISFTSGNDVPVLNSASLTVTEGATVTLTTADFGITDSDDTSFTYNLTAITGGQFELTTVPGASTTSFNSAQLTANQVVFVDNGDETAPSFDVTVSDGSANSNTMSATISYTPQNDTPVLDTATLSVTEGATVTLTASNFGITDPDSSTFTYSLSSTTGGQFELTSAPGVSITSFSSAQLATNQVVFVDNGDETAPSFDVTINDGMSDSNTLSASIFYTPQNDTPFITSHGGNGSVSMALNENSASVTTVSASDHDGDILSYGLIGGADLGVFAVDASTGELFFDQLPDAEDPRDADQDNVYHVQVAVSDGNGGVDHQAFIIEVMDVDEFDVGLLLDVDESLDMVSPLNSISDQVGITVIAEDRDEENNIITYSLDDDAGGMFTIDPATGVILLANNISNSDLSGYEVTVRATSEDGSYAVKTFSIALYSLDEPESESGFLDEIIYDLSPVDETDVTTAVDEVSVSEPDQLGVSEPTNIASDAESFEVSVGGLVQIVEPLPTEDIENRFNTSVSGQDGLTANGSDSMKARLTPVPVPSDHLPRFNSLSDDVVEVPDALWSLLDVMNQEMSRSHSEGSGEDGLVLKTTAFGTVVLSAGYVAWLLRAGALSASLLSSAPLWRQVDPLPVLSARAKEREKDIQDAPVEDPQEKRLSKLFGRSKKIVGNRSLSVR